MEKIHLSAINEKEVIEAFLKKVKELNVEAGEENSIKEELLYYCQDNLDRIEQGEEGEDIQAPRDMWYNIVDECHDGAYHTDDFMQYKSNEEKEAYVEITEEGLKAFFEKYLSQD
jgi:hypothetical protein